MGGPDRATAMTAPLSPGDLDITSKGKDQPMSTTTAHATKRPLSQRIQTKAVARDQRPDAPLARTTHTHTAGVTDSCSCTSLDARLAGPSWTRGAHTSTPARRLLLPSTACHLTRYVEFLPPRARTASRRWTSGCSETEADWPNTAIGSLALGASCTARAGLDRRAAESDRGYYLGLFDFILTGGGMMGCGSL